MLCDIRFQDCRVYKNILRTSRKVILFHYSSSSSQNCHIEYKCRLEATASPFEWDIFRVQQYTREYENDLRSV